GGGSRPAGQPLVDGDDLDGLAGALRLVADALADQGAGERRDMADGTGGGVGLVLAGDAPGLGAAVLALDGHGAAEADPAVGDGLDQLGRSAAGRPVAQVAGGAGHGGAVRLDVAL